MSKTELSKSNGSTEERPGPAEDVKDQARTTQLWTHAKDAATGLTHLQRGKSQHRFSDIVKDVVDSDKLKKLFVGKKSNPLHKFKKAFSNKVDTTSESRLGPDAKLQNLIIAVHVCSKNGLLIDYSFSFLKDIEDNNDKTDKNESETNRDEIVSMKTDEDEWDFIKRMAVRKRLPHIICVPIIANGMMQKIVAVVDPNSVWPGSPALSALMLALDTMAIETTFARDLLDDLHKEGNKKGAKAEWPTTWDLRWVDTTDWEQKLEDANIMLQPNFPTLFLRPHQSMQSHSQNSHLQKYQIEETRSLGVFNVDWEDKDDEELAAKFEWLERVRFGIEHNTLQHGYKLQENYATRQYARFYQQRSKKMKETEISSWPGTEAAKRRSGKNFVNHFKNHVKHSGDDGMEGVFTDMVNVLNTVVKTVRDLGGALRVPYIEKVNPGSIKEKFLAQCRKEVASTGTNVCQVPVLSFASTRGVNEEQAAKQVADCEMPFNLLSVICVAKQIRKSVTTSRNLIKNVATHLIVLPTKEVPEHVSGPTSNSLENVESDFVRGLQSTESKMEASYATVNDKELKEELSREGYQTKGKVVEWQNEEGNKEEVIIEFPKNEEGGEPLRENRKKIAVNKEKVQIEGKKSWMTSLCPAHELHNSDESSAERVKSAWFSIEEHIVGPRKIGWFYVLCRGISCLEALSTYVQRNVPVLCIRETGGISDLIQLLRECFEEQMSSVVSGTKKQRKEDVLAAFDKFFLIDEADHTKKNTLRDEILQMYSQESLDAESQIGFLKAIVNAGGQEQQLHFYGTTDSDRDSLHKSTLRLAGKDPMLDRAKYQASMLLVQMTDSKKIWKRLLIAITAFNFMMGCLMCISGDKVFTSLHKQYEEIWTFTMIALPAILSIFISTMDFMKPDEKTLMASIARQRLLEQIYQYVTQTGLYHRSASASSKSGPDKTLQNMLDEINKQITSVGLVSKPGGKSGRNESDVTDAISPSFANNHFIDFDTKIADIPCFMTGDLYCKRRLKPNLKIIKNDVKRLESGKIQTRVACLVLGALGSLIATQGYTVLAGLPTTIVSLLVSWRQTMRYDEESSKKAIAAASLERLYNEWKTLQEQEKDQSRLEDLVHDAEEVIQDMQLSPVQPLPKSNARQDTALDGDGHDGDDSFEKDEATKKSQEAQEAMKAELEAMKAEKEIQTKLRPQGLARLGSIDNQMQGLGGPGKSTAQIRAKQSPKRKSIRQKKEEQSETEPE